MIKICYVIGTLEIGGAEKQLLKLCRGLDKSKFAPTVICLRGGPLKRDFEAAGIPVIEAGKRWKIDIAFLFRLAGIIRGLKPDIVHTWMFTSNTWGRLTAVWSGVPVIIASERCVDPWKRWYHVAVDRFLLRWTVKVIANSHAVERFYAQLESIPAEKLAVIYNGIEPAAISSAGVRYAVGCAGRFTEQKGFIYLIEAMPAVLAAFPGARFVFVGDGPLMESFREAAKRLGVEGNVVFTGYRNDVVDIFSLCDVIAVPSLFEGMPNVVLEAMMLKKPVVGSNIPEIAELVNDGETGLLVPAKDAGALAKAIVRLLKDERTRRDMGEHGYEFVRRSFSVRTMVARYEKAYDESFLD